MNIILLTNSFPFGNGETFIDNELPFLSQHFENVFIVPLKTRRDDDLKKNDRLLPENCKFILPVKKNIIEIQIPSILNIGKLLGLLIKTGIEEFRTLKTAMLFLKPKNLLVTIIRLNRAIAYEKEFENIIQETGTQNILVYSYWVDSWLIGILNLRNRLNLKFKVISRAHRGDLYHYAGTIGYQTSRKYIWKHIDFVFPISKMGCEYLLNLYPELEDKIQYSYLGVKDYKILSPYKKRDEISIVSCSNLISVKRVHLIIECLKLIPKTLNVNWIHIGAGILKEHLIKEAEQLPTNITYKFEGHLRQEEIMKLYIDNQFDLFINVSESEGIPVSIMEAISLGIPVLATNVGGTSEVVTKNFGYLISKDFKDKEIATIIESHSLKTEGEVRKMRQNAYDFYLENFKDEKNYSGFIEILKSIGNS